MIRSVAIALLLSFFAITAVGGQNESAAYESFRAGDYDRAVIIARQSLLNNPNNIDSRVVLSWSMLATGKNQDALNAALEAQKLAPDDERIIGVIGEAYYQLGSYLDALPFLERYTALAPTGVAVARVHAIMGEIFIEFGEYHHARAALGAAVRFDPSVALWWGRLGFVYEQLQDEGRAGEYYQQSLALNPTTEVQQALNRLNR